MGIDLDDLKANTEYKGNWKPDSKVIKWFWEVLEEMDDGQRALFLQFCTGTSKVPSGGFESLQGMNGVQRFQIAKSGHGTDALPAAHTCFNQLDLPQYSTK